MRSIAINRDTLHSLFLGAGFCRFRDSIGTTVHNGVDGSHFQVGESGARYAGGASISADGPTSNADLARQAGGVSDAGRGDGVYLLLRAVLSTERRPAGVLSKAGEGGEAELLVPSFL